MTCYIVTFHIAEQPKREAVKAALQTYSGYCPIHENCWAVLTDKTAVVVRDHLMGLITTTDRVFVIRTGTEAAWNGLYGEANAEWLKKNL